MAGTVTISAALQVEHAPFSFQWARQASLAQTGRGMAAALHYVGETPETINYGEVLYPGVVVLHNISGFAGGHIVWGVLDGGEFRPVGFLAPGEFAVIRLARPGVPPQSVVLQAKAADAGYTAALQPYVFES